MSHINAYVPTCSQWQAEETITRLRAERELWERRAAYLRDELANIPKALREYGEWYITDENGATTYVILDPQHHPKGAGDE